MEFNHIDVEKWECKAVGVARNNVEAYARFNMGMDADLVRKLSADGYDTVQKFMEYKANNKTEKTEKIEEKKEDEKAETTAPVEDVVWPSIDVLRAFLKEKGVKGSHLYGYEKALATAIENGYVI